ncbi:hypothetical protein [Pyxidicoccus caerfyrddinensis]|nr:hypothetical protein [Pyxidicoccus caerfyrddinensis]
MKGMADLLRLYWLALHHGLVVQGDNHALRINVDAGSVVLEKKPVA